MKTVIVSLSKKSGPKKEKSPRSKFLSAMMKKFGGEFGDSAAEAFDKQDADALRSVFQEVANSLIAQWGMSGKTGH